MHLPKPERKAAQSYVRARLDEARTSRAQMGKDDIDSNDSATMRTRDSSPDLALGVLPAPRYQPALPPSQTTLCRPTAMTPTQHVPRAFVPLPKLAYGSIGGCPSLSPAHALKTPTSSVGSTDSPRTPGAVIPVARVKDVDHLSWSSRSYHGYAMPFVRGE
ncbi:hypothetical protein CALVIDRAFT_534970 [Calocera viscosa TUFC12733]|uniref:Uncharacterized protein n=1 Tax=Calocera viscosa (strain TUFC12733) TaxID=1330018 RepID=A0A167PJV3_CALVF|nr:hypothetical protein CALVIDRAFT_534970 [Calocera viscosa TUFC12733]